MNRSDVSKRPAIVTAVIAIHTAAAIFLVGLSFFLLWLTRSPEILWDQDAASTIQGLKIGAFAVVLPALFWLPGIYGMWKRRAWGWGLTLMTGMSTALILLYSAVDDGWARLDVEDATVAGVCLILPLFMLLPQVRKYFRPPQSEVAPVLDVVQGNT